VHSLLDQLSRLPGAEPGSGQDVRMTRFRASGRILSRRNS
jgi:hypothetical protein